MCLWILRPQEKSRGGHLIKGVAIHSAGKYPNLLPFVLKELLKKKGLRVYIEDRGEDLSHGKTGECVYYHVTL